MSLLDSVIRETGEKFGLGNKAGDLVDETLQYMIDPGQGGLRGFIDRFETAGFGDQVASWIRKGGEKKHLTGQELRSAIGPELIRRTASVLGLGRPSVRPALAFVVPKLIDVLTPDGLVPEMVSADVRSFLSSASAGVSVSTTPRETAPLEDGAGMPWWAWLLALLWAGLLAYWALGQPYDEAAPKAAVAQPKAAIPARLALSNVGGKVEFSGVVTDERTRSSVLDLLTSVFGEGNVIGSLNIDGRVARAKWLAYLRVALDQVKIPGADLVFEGDRVSVGGWLSDSDQSNVLDTLKSIFGPGFSFARLGDKVGEVVKTASERTVAGLDALRPGYSGAQLVKALNLWVINFASDSAEIPAESSDVLPRAAKAINAAPGSMVIEIRGHTDDTGDPAANLALSQARAESVRKALLDAGANPSVLRTKGYGSERPVASNDTPDGRFRNRRIEFVVVE